MSAESPIYVSSTENSVNSTPMSSRESSPVITEWIHDPEPSGPDPLPFQNLLDRWSTFDNLHPTSEEVRFFIRDVGQLFQCTMREHRDRMNQWNEERLEVRGLLFHIESFD